MWKCLAFICKAFSLNRLRNVHTFCSRAAILDATVKPIGENSLETYLHVLCLDSHIFHCTKEKIVKGKEKDGPRPVKTTCAPSQYLQCRPCVNDLTDRGPPQKWPTAFFGVHSISFKGKRRPSQVTKTRERLLTFCWQLHVCRWRKSLHWHFVQSKRVAVSCVDRK